MAKIKVTDRMAPDSIKSFEANLEMIRKVRDIGASSKGYNLPLSRNCSFTETKNPEQGLFGIVARNNNY